MICIVVDEENVGVVLVTDNHVAISIESHRTSLVCSVVHKTEGTRNCESAVNGSDGCALVSNKFTATLQKSTDAFQ